jgi:hypothetical protein
MSRIDRLNNRGPPRVENRRSSTDGLLEFCNVDRGGGVDEVLEVRNGGSDAGVEARFDQRPMHHKGEFSLGTFRQDTVAV